MRPREDIERIIKKFDVNVNPNKDRQILDELCHAQAKSKPSKPRLSTIGIWRIIMESKMTKFATTAVVIIAAIIITNPFGGSIDGTNVAFAKVMEHFVTAHTARFDLSIEFGDQEPQTSSFLYNAKGYIRQNMANGTVNFIDYNRNKVFSLSPDSKTVVIRDVRKPDFNIALYDIFTKLQDLIQQAIDLGHGPVESLGTKTIDGHTTYGYRIETTGQSPGLYWQGKGTLTIWADAETDFPLNLKWHNIMTNIIATVSNIRLNSIFSPDETSIAIPQGYTIRDETLPPAEPEPKLKEPHATQEDNIESDDTPETTAQQPQIDQISDSNISDLIEGLDKNEQTLIKFFKSWIFFTKDKFPSSLTVDAIKDIDPDAKINFKVKLWSTEFSADMPNLFGDWKPDIDPNDYTQEEIQQAKDKCGPYYQELQKKYQEHLQTYKPFIGNIVEGFKLINEFPADSNWHYNGQVIKPGNSDTAIFWYKPNGAKTYRVIYGDLTIEDIGLEDLHLLENPSDDEIDRQANAVLEIALQLGADIPKDKRSKALRMLSLKEKDLLKGLATYLKYSDDRYPASMIIDKSFMKDIEALSNKAINQGRIDKKTSEKEIFEIFYAGSFYDKLTREKKEPAYYGSTATLTDPNAILIRWKLSKNKYRVIYTSLKAETVTTEKLAELEKASIPK
jgi:outer membrane lipoprotein-sorting protein